MSLVLKPVCGLAMTSAGTRCTTKPMPSGTAPARWRGTQLFPEECSYPQRLERQRVDSFH